MHSLDCTGTFLAFEWTCFETVFLYRVSYFNQKFPTLYIWKVSGLQWHIFIFSFDFYYFRCNLTSDHHRPLKNIFYSFDVFLLNSNYIVAK